MKKGIRYQPDIWKKLLLPGEDGFGPLNSRLQSKVVLTCSLLLVLLWQGYYYCHRDQINDEVRRKYTTGFAYNLAQNFIYFYYYTGYFPIYSTSADPEFSEQGAEKIMQKHGETLFMECEHWSRLGENARIFAFIPNAIIDGDTRLPSITLFNTLFFIAGLFSIIIGFYLQGRMLMGLLIVLLTGGSPFYLYETYVNENIFGLATAVAYLLLGLLLPALFSKTRRSDWFIATCCGVLIGFVYNIRAEILPLLVVPVLIYLLHRNYRLSKKGMLILFVLLSFYSMNKVIRHYFDLKFAEAYEVVSERGGHPYNGRSIASHSFWHPVFCGLGDYDKKYGYTEWKDSIAYSYAIPVLKEKYGMDLEYEGGLHLNEYYDEDRYYYKKFDELPHYDEVIKDKVLTDISNDPLWYINILLKRINKVLNNTSPIGFGNYYWKMKGVGWLIIPVLLLLIIWRAWSYLKLLLFVVPLLATPLLIYSGGNATFNSPYQIILISFLLTFLIEGWILYFSKK